MPHQLLKMLKIAEKLLNRNLNLNKSLKMTKTIYSPFFSHLKTTVKFRNNQVLKTVQKEAWNQIKVKTQRMQKGSKRQITVFLVPWGCWDENII